MRFDYLNLRAFGHFTDYELTFDEQKNFHLIYGPNEAGKSTALNSIPHFLFGFPQQTNYSFLHQNSKLRIEGQLHHSSGQRFPYVRRKGNKRTVLGLDGEELQQKNIDDFLNGMTEEHFLNMFALDHVRLREGGESLLHSGGDLGESLFSAASGISVLRKIFDELEKKSGDLFKKRGSAPELNKLLKEEKELKKSIAEYQLKIQAWKDLEKKYENGKKEIEDMIKEVRALRSEQEKLQRVKLTLPKIAKQRELARKLQELGDVPDLQDNSEQLRKENQQILENAQRMKKKSADEQDKIEEEIKTINLPEGLIEQASLIDSLYRELQSYQNSVGQIPRLEGEYRQLSTRVLSFMKEIDLMNADLTKIDLYRLSAEKKEMIRELCKEKPLLDQMKEKMERTRLEIEDELKEKEGSLNEMNVLPNTDELGATIDIVKRAGQFEDTLKKLNLERKQKEWQIIEETKQLPLWEDTYSELIKLSVPGLIETIQKYEQDEHNILQNLQNIRNQLSEKIIGIESAEQRIRELESLAEIPSEETLITVRKYREQGWELIRKKLKNDKWNQGLENFTHGQEVDEVYEKSVRDADHVADKMRFEAAKVGEKNKLLADIANSKKKMDELENEENLYIEKLEIWKGTWQKLWEPSTIVPLSPTEMGGWLVKYNRIKELVQDFEKGKAVILELEETKNKYQQMLINEISKYELVNETKTVDGLLRIAEMYFKNFQDQQYNRKSLHSSILETKKKLENINSEKMTIENKLEIWKSKWINAIRGTTISENSPVSVAERLLGIYENCTLSYDELTQIEKKQKIMQEEISLFETKVKDVLVAIDLELSVENYSVVVNQLYAHLQKAKQDQIHLTALVGQLKNLQNEMKVAEGEMAEAESNLLNLMKLAKCQSLEGLEQAEKRFQSKKDLEDKIQAVEEELLELGNGRSLNEIIQEADQLDSDEIEAVVEEITRRLDEIEPMRSQIEQEHGVVKKEFEEKIQGNNTASIIAQQKKESLLAQVANLTDQYIQVKLASTLLKKGIEYYRNQNQDPIIRRASGLFERLTLQSFTGLTVDYDEKDQPVLMGVRANGEKVPVGGMSDGTTDQLYLSLRIASIEKYVDENEPIPFIVDDILVHFDDYRSKETLKILLELSKKTQIIFFTHHDRLVETMKEIVDENGCQVINLNHDKLPVIV
jgi:uncharacterized protein YhaN